MHVDERLGFFATSPRATREILSDFLFQETGRPFPITDGFGPALSTIGLVHGLWFDDGWLKGQAVFYDPPRYAHVDRLTYALTISYEDWKMRTGLRDMRLIALAVPDPETRQLLAEEAAQYG